MMTEQDHIPPTPWTHDHFLIRHLAGGTDEDGVPFSEVVATALNTPTAALICQAVNAHAGLAAENARITAERANLRRVVQRMLDLDDGCDYVDGTPAVCPGPDGPCQWCDMRAALKAMEE